MLQTDGYAGYNKAARSAAAHAGCWAHLRRYCVDAVKLNPRDAVATWLVERMDALFAVDREAAEARLTPASRLELRQEKSAAIVEEIHQKMLAVKASALPKSKLGEAVGYALGQWPGLTVFLRHGEMELSNNLAENSMRPIALGRRNWIHIGSVDAGPRVAAILSVVETCKRLGIPVRQYLADVLPGLADRKASEVARLTPIAWKLRRSE